MPDWTAFGAVAGFVLFLVLGLAWTTSGRLGGRRRRSDEPMPVDSASGDEWEQGDVTTRAQGVEQRLDDEQRPDDGGGQTSSVTAETSRAGASRSTSTTPVPNEAPESDGVESIPTAALLANVVATHGGLGLLLLGAVALTGIPAAALGAEATSWSTGAPAVLGGLALGGTLAAANVALAASLDRFGVDHSEDLRAALAPESALGWGVLLLAILPLVAAFEELLFRAVLIGAATGATGVSPWLFVVLSSVAFALGHGIQGRSGILVTGLLGGVLGVAFVLTNSLLLVVIAHYVVNAVEFLLKELLGVDLDGRR